MEVLTYMSIAQILISPGPHLPGSGILPQNTSVIKDKAHTFFPTAISEPFTDYIANDNFTDNGRFNSAQLTSVMDPHGRQD